MMMTSRCAEDESLQSSYSQYNLNPVQSRTFELEVGVGATACRELRMSEASLLVSM